MWLESFSKIIFKTQLSKKEYGLEYLNMSLLYFFSLFFHEKTSYFVLNYVG